MNRPPNILCLFLLFLPLPGEIVVVNGERPRALFVFGDSYADTGNHDSLDPNLSQPWKPPYGNTWPGNPAGRFSDGFVLTDYIAKFLNLPSPTPFRSLQGRGEMSSTGVNFAYGGSGLFDTYGPDFINISTQIDQFQQISSEHIIDYANSLVLFVYGGNDYSVHLQKSGRKGIPFLITRVVRRISTELMRLHTIGFRRFAVTNLEPAGCLPFITTPKSMANCSRTDNVLSSVHNRILAQMLVTMRTFRSRDSEYVILDQYEAFLEVLSSTSNYGFAKDVVLQSCCQGIKKEAKCGSVDDQGNPLYTICEDTSRIFFWDGAHPTQAGWGAVTQHYESQINSFI